MAFVDDPIRTVYKYDSYLEELKKETNKDKDFINSFYRNNRANSINNISNNIKNIIRNLFVVNFIKDYNKLLINDILITIGFAILYLYGNTALLNFGYIYLAYVYFLLLSFTILIIILNISKFRGFLTTIILFVSSIIIMNNSVYNASKENIYNEKYHKMIVDNNLSKTEFFIENIKQLNLLKQN